MIIRREQLRAFEAYMAASFEDRMVAHVKAGYPRQYAAYAQEGEGDAGVRRLVQHAIERSIALGARRESSIQQMLEIMLETSPDFESNPSMDWIREIFADPMLSGGTRILLAHQKLPAQPARAGRNEV